MNEDEIKLRREIELLVIGDDAGEPLSSSLSAHSQAIMC